MAPVSDCCCWETRLAGAFIQGRARGGAGGVGPTVFEMVNCGFYPFLLFRPPDLVSCLSCSASNFILCSLLFFFFYITRPRSCSLLQSGALTCVVVFRQSWWCRMSARCRAAGGTRDASSPFLLCLFILGKTGQNARFFFIVPPFFKSKPSAVLSNPIDIVQF